MKKILIAALTAVAVVASTVLPANAAFAAAYPSDGPDVSASYPHTVPVFEPQVGRGSPLLAGVPQQISLGPTAATAHSALVRVSVFTASEQSELSLAGSPALVVEAGHSASTAVLVPVVSGAVSLLSSRDVNARLEVLALFDGDAEAVGSTVALAAPITRADSADGFEGSTIGLVGLGGVPSEFVRAVFVTVIVQGSAAGVVDVDGQHLEINAGKTIISTIVTPSIGGDIEIALPETASAIRVDVRGYVAEAALASAALNGPGSYWPVADPSALELAATAGEPTPVDFGDDAVGEYVVALVSATPTGQLTMLDTGTVRSGRAEGAVVDPDAGTQQQLEIVPTSSAALQLRRGESTVTLLPLGALLGATSAASNGPSISIATPTETNLDVTEHVTFDFDGVLSTPGSTPLRVEVIVNGDPLTVASIRPTEDGIAWHYTAAVPTTGFYDIEFKLVDRGGATASTTWSGHVTMPSASATVLSARSIAIGSAGHAVNIVELADDWVSFDGDPYVTPGDIITSVIAPNAPEGFLRKVSAIDVRDGIWVVATEMALLTESILQIDLDTKINPPMPDPSSIVMGPDVNDPTYETKTQTFEVLPIDQIDVDPYLGEAFGGDGVEIVGQRDHSLEKALSVSSAESHTLPGFAKTIISNTYEPTWGVVNTIEVSQIIGLGTDTPVPGIGDETTGHPNAGGVDASLRVKTKSTTTSTISVKLVMKIEMNFTPLMSVSLVKYLNTARSVTKTVTETELYVKLHLRLEVPFIAVGFDIPLCVPATPICFTIAIGIQPVIRVDISAAVGVGWTSGEQSTSERGMLYQNGVTSSYSDGPTTTRKPTTFNGGVELTGTIELSAGLLIKIELLLFGATGPSIEIEPTFGLRLTLHSDVTNGATAEFGFFLQLRVALKWKFKIPILGFELLNLTVLEKTWQWPIGTYDVLVSTIVEGSEIGDGDPDPQDPDEPDDPSDPVPGEICEAFTDGSVRFVCTASEFNEALGNAAYSKIALLQSVDTWEQPDHDVSALGCNPADEAPAGLSTTVSRSLTLDMQGHQLCLHGLQVSGVTLSIEDHPWNVTPGSLGSAAHASSGAAGITLSSAILDVKSGVVTGFGAGNGAGVSTTGSTVKMNGGSLNGFGAGGGAGIGGNSQAQGGTIQSYAGSMYGEGSLAGTDDADGGAGIGGGYRAQAGGTITVYGGSVTGSGGDGAAGIGGGAYGAGPSLTVVAGTVNGFGGGNSSSDDWDTPDTTSGGAGIGGGFKASGGYTLITGGTVSGWGEDGSSGIGGGSQSYGGSLRVTGGYVTAFIQSGGNAGAAIGGGYLGSGGSITVEGGTVQGFAQEGNGAGIGGGGLGDGGDIVITGGIVKGFSHYGTDVTDPFAGGAGIGGGSGGASGSISVSGADVSGYGYGGGAGIGGGRSGASTAMSFASSTVFATGDLGSAAIGGGVGAASGDISITGSSVQAYTDGGGAAIGSGSEGDAGDFTIDSSTVTAYGYTGAAGIGSGVNGDAGSITITASSITAGGFDFEGGGGAGIGSGSGGNVGEISITDTAVQASSSAGGAGIGSGRAGQNLDITLTDVSGMVNASDDSLEGTSFDGGAAIGSGAEGTSGDITVVRGTFTATAQGGAAAIGSGARATAGDVSIDGLITGYLVGGGGGTGVGSGAYGSAGNITITSASLSAFGGDGGAGIGGGQASTVGTIVISATTVGQVVGGGGAAGIGSGADGTVLTISVDGSTISAYSADGGAGIGASRGSDGPGITITSTTLEIHIGSADPVIGSGAGIGGGTNGDGGSITIDGATLYVTSGAGGAAIGGGQSGDGGVISISDSTMSGIIAAGAGAAGIGGGRGGAGGIITIDASTLDILGGSGLEIPPVEEEPDPDEEPAPEEDPEEPEEPLPPVYDGGGAAIGGGAFADGGSVSITASNIHGIAGNGAAAIGGGQGGSGATVVVDADSVLTLHSDAGVSAIGNGLGGADFGSLTMDGTLLLDSASLIIPAGTELTLNGRVSGVPVADPVDIYLETASSISGEGTVHNLVAITTTVDPALTVTDNVFAIRFEQNHSENSDATTATVYATTFTLGRRYLATPATIPGWLFVGWNTSADGLGTEFTSDTVLTGDVTVYAIWETE